MNKGSLPCTGTLGGHRTGSYQKSINLSGEVGSSGSTITSSNEKREKQGEKTNP